MLNAFIDFLLSLFTREPEEDEAPRVFEQHEDMPLLELEPADPISIAPEEPETPVEPIEILEPEPEPELEPEPEPDIEEPGRMKIGAWAGSASLANPERDVRFCVETGIDRLDLIVNDHSGSRMPRDFTMRRIGKIKRLVEVAREHGIEVHFMSWIMPHRNYIKQAAEQLVPICNDLGITSLQWDAEEPWTQAKQAMRYSAAAKLIATEFADLECPMGVNGIGYTPPGKFRPLAEICSYVVPQCYATKSSRLNPTTCVPRFVRRYRAKFGADKPVQVGLAAYRQPPKGFTVESAMTASFASAEAIENCDAVIYWSLGWIRRSRRIASIIRKLSQERQQTMIDQNARLS